MNNLLKKKFRTHNCNQLNSTYINKSVILTGWIHKIRRLGYCTFIDLRDNYGVTQLVIPANNINLSLLSGYLSNEWCVIIEGFVQDRLINGGSYNFKIKTGTIEINLTNIQIYNDSKKLPFPIKNDINSTEETRLVNRILDLRRSSINKIFKNKNIIYRSIRNIFNLNHFIEIETPILVKYTPGGARNFLVPSRLHLGKFYALSESPQLFKQMLMIAGFDRYYQIIKCFRDEDNRGDRQPEFTQIDMEMSYIHHCFILKFIEKVIFNIFYTFNLKIKKNYCIISYDEALSKYGTDKPDLRIYLTLNNLTSYFIKHIDSLPFFFQNILKKGESIKCFSIKEHEIKISRKDIKLIENFSKSLNLSKLILIKIKNKNNDWGNSSLGNQMNSSIKSFIHNQFLLQEGDYLFFLCGNNHSILKHFLELKKYLYSNLLLNKKNIYKPIWITKFPLFKMQKNNKSFVSNHHPFTIPISNKIQNLRKIYSKSYDLVINGVEIGGGSIRIHNINKQKDIFKILNIKKQIQNKKFGFFINSLSYGTPPHGGFALGIDRLLMLILLKNSIRETIVFPKNQNGLDPLTKAPSVINNKILGNIKI